MGFGVINAINIELKSDEEKSNKSNSDLQAAEKGEGTEKNLEKAFYWYQKAAENGDKEAQFNLGVCYEEGIGIEKDEVEASYWYQEAAQQGFSNAHLDRKTNEYFIITQYANGGDLQSYLKENFKNLTWNDKKKLAFQIADGLNCLHNENVLHRDLHSKNIVIHENNAKITFEFAKMGVGVNSGKKNKFIEDDDDYDDDDDDDDDDTELLLLILFNKYYLNHADDDDYDDDDDDDDDDTELLFLNNDNFNNSEAKDSIFWSDALETRLCELYIKDDVY
ncbi:unnamed protein product [Rhizophagus irregularis]|nr:unnamed protein product [Rhizophagus irregularis]